MARFRLETSPGLVSMAAAARRSTEPGLVWQHTQRLPGGLPVVIGPAGAVQACAALGEITGRQASVLRRAADRAGTVVIADCGRIDTDSLAMAVLRVADVMVLLSRARDDALSHVATRLSAAARWSPRPCFVLVGDGYPTTEVSQTLGIPVIGRLPYDPRGAAVLGGETSRRSAPARSLLGRAMVDLAAAIAYHAQAEALVSNNRGAPGYAPPPSPLGHQQFWASAPAASPNGVPR
ncbi:hypothetical protein [Streptantibioticus ferralitis]|uniref:MinD-like ATPase involved in chromosome partitioning or flagellar assembly n=1 Tax=Streptantibioticus ferralitis TaxID=236510 RepID=A0ABT5Z3H2_9ACTN|nr:hypothetical protein [Streptantibioticus ferralitis]MDF2258383.1 hypothetical protein [Streptantibioticus ferralitis]